MRAVSTESLVSKCVDDHCGTKCQCPRGFIVSGRSEGRVREASLLECALFLISRVNQEHTKCAQRRRRFATRWGTLYSTTSVEINPMPCQPSTIILRTHALSHSHCVPKECCVCMNLFTLFPFTEIVAILGTGPEAWHCPDTGISQRTNCLGLNATL